MIFGLHAMAGTAFSGRPITQRWNTYSNAQNASWSTISNVQTPAWSEISNSQTPGWTDVVTGLYD